MGDRFTTLFECFISFQVVHILIGNAYTVFLSQKTSRGCNGPEVRIKGNKPRGKI